MKNTINFTISQETCDKIASAMKMVRSPKAVIYSHMYKNTKEYAINDCCDAIGATGMYKKGEGLKLTIGISDDLIDAAVDAMITFVPAMTGAIASLAGHVGRFKKLLKIDDERKKIRVVIDKGDKVRLAYTIGRSKNAMVKTIVIGRGEMGEKIDHLLVGLPAGAMIRTDLDVLGVKTRMDILVREIVKADQSTIDTKELAGVAGHEHGGNPAVRFSCYETGDVTNENDSCDNIDESYVDGDNSYGNDDESYTGDGDPYEVEENGDDYEDMDVPDDYYDNVEQCPDPIDDDEDELGGNYVPDLTGWDKV